MVKLSVTQLYRYNSLDHYDDSSILPTLVQKENFFIHWGLWRAFENDEPAWAGIIFSKSFKRSLQEIQFNRELYTKIIGGYSLVPRRSLLPRCPREVWERAGERTPSQYWQNTPDFRAILPLVTFEFLQLQAVMKHMLTIYRFASFPLSTTVRNLGSSIVQRFIGTCCCAWKST